MLRQLKQLLRGEEGVTAIEYALLASLIGVAIVITVTSLGTELDSIYKTISSTISKVAA